MKFQRNASRLLPVMLALSLLTLSCGGNAGTEKETERGTSPAVTGTEPAVTEPDFLETLPAADWNGADFRILANSAADRPNLHEDHETGELVNDTMYRRDVRVEELFGLHFVYTPYETRFDLSDAVRKQVTAGDDTSELLITTLGDGVGSLAMNGYLYDLAEIPTLGLSNPWWCPSMNRTMDWNGQIYAAAGPLVLCYNYAMYSFFLNSTMAAQFDLGDLYAEVENGTWTVERMNAMMKGVEADLNSDGKMDIADRYGLTVTEEAGKAFYIGCGKTMIEKSGDTVISHMTDDDAVTVLDRLHTVMAQESVIYTDDLGSNNAGISYKIALFTNGQALFCAAPLQWGVLYFRDMKDDYCVLPFPKYDEAQKQYATHLNAYLPSAAAVPVTTGRTEQIGAVMDALGYLSETTLVPVIKDVVLKEKIARDEGSARMFRLLYDNIVIDMNTVYNFGGTADFLRSYAVANTDNYASGMAKLEKSMQKDIEKMIKTYQND